MPGGDLLRQMEGLHPAPPDATEVKPKGLSSGKGGSGGGGGSSPNQKAEAEKRDQLEWETWEKEDAKKEEAAPPPDESKVTLRNPRWDREKGDLEGKALASVDVELPQEYLDLPKHFDRKLTSVAFHLDVTAPNGKKKLAKTEQASVKDGKAELEFDLQFPPHLTEGGKEPAECEFSFRAKHAHSKEVESGPLKAKKPFATNIRWEKAEGWVGAPVRLLADTSLKDGEEVLLKVATENAVAVDTKIKAKQGKLEFSWTPCLCGIQLEVGGKLPGKVEMYGDLTHGQEKAAPFKPYRLRMVVETDWEPFSKDFTWNNFGVHSAFKLKIEGLKCKVLVRESVIKAWGAYWIRMKRANMTGRDGGGSLGWIPVGAGERARNDSQ